MQIKIFQTMKVRIFYLKTACILAEFPVVLDHIYSRGHSSAGRALRWHRRGRRFDPAWLHHFQIQSHPVKSDNTLKSATVIDSFSH